MEQLEATRGGEIGSAAVPADPDSDLAPRLAVINGLRGVAILGVLYFHLLSHHLTPAFESVAVPVGPYLFSPYSLLSNGWLGVNLFFLLSGFVLALPYALGRRTMQSGGDALSFYVRRGRRLLPLYYLCLFVAVLVETRAGAELAIYVDAVSAATFAFVFQERHFVVRFNVVLWSLGVEFWFSVAFPLLLLAFQRFGVAATTLAAIVLALGTRFHDARQWTGHPIFLLPLKDGPFGRLDDFVVGMGLCHLYVRRPLSSRALATALLVLGIALLTLGAVEWDNIQYGRLPFIASAVLNDVILLGFALVLMALLGGVPRALRFVFTLAPLQLAGMMCYSLYLWHLVGMRPFTDPLLDARYTAVRLVLTLVVSALTYRLVEFPNKSARSLFFDYVR